MSGEYLIPARYWFFVVCLLAAVLGLPWWLQSTAGMVVGSLLALLTLVGFIDVFQKRRAIRRNYPIIAHMRFLLESIRPEIRQYFIESDAEQVPFSRVQRSIVYQRAKGELDKRPFGTQLDVYAADHEWINHSLQPVEIADRDFRVDVGGADCRLPYRCSVFNISAMSFGSLSANAILALNAGAKRGGFYHDTGEGSISPYHREHGGDLVWEIGTGYFGCRQPDGRFDAARFAENATQETVRMIEIKLSQGAKPGQGGILPGAKVTAEIASTRGVPLGVDCVSPAAHAEFNTPIGLLEFVARLRELSGGKPTGFKLAIGHPWEWMAIARAMLATGITPDFIVVDGAEGGTGAAPLEFSDHVGVPMQEALLLVHNTLVGINLRERVRVAAAGKLITAFDLARTLALGADWCNSARGFMFALGCIQSQSCHTSRCPTGVATQDPVRARALHVADKAERVWRFHDSTVKALAELIAAAGVAHPDELGPQHLITRLSPTEVRSLASVLPRIERGSLLGSELPDHKLFQAYWPLASADSFRVDAGKLEQSRRIALQVSA